jgi:hypothetical protein
LRLLPAGLAEQGVACNTGRRAVVSCHGLGILSVLTVEM